MESETSCRSLMNSEENPIHVPENTGILLTELADRAQWLVGVRNVAAHEYTRRREWFQEHLIASWSGFYVIRLSLFRRLKTYHSCLATRNLRCIFE